VRRAMWLCWCLAACASSRPGGTEGDCPSSPCVDAPPGDPGDGGPTPPALDAAVTDEPCNGLDDDGDGAVDEGCACPPGATQPCHHDPASAGVGACVRGTQTCQGGELGSWSSCVGDVLPGPEICDGAIDQDCDGVVDQGCACVNGTTQPCGPSTGECVPGARACVDGQWGTCSGGRGPATELCNGLDDDCDGVVDNGCPVCVEVPYAWNYPDGCTLTTRSEYAVAPASFWPGRPLYARLLSSYFDDCGQVGNLSLPVTGCAQGPNTNIPSPTDIASLTPDQRAIPVTVTNLACFAYQAQIRVRWCVTYTP